MWRKRIVSDEAILDAIGSFMESNGYSPSYDEIAAIVGFKSKSSLSKRIESLRRRGNIAYIPGKQRTLRVVRCYDATRTHVREESDAVECV